MNARNILIPTATALAVIGAVGLVYAQSTAETGASAPMTTQTTTPTPATTTLMTAPVITTPKAQEPAQQPSAAPRTSVPMTNDSAPMPTERAAQADRN